MTRELLVEMLNAYQRVADAAHEYLDDANSVNRDALSDALITLAHVVEKTNQIGENQ